MQKKSPLTTPTTPTGNFYSRHSSYQPNNRTAWVPITAEGPSYRSEFKTHYDEFARYFATSPLAKPTVDSANARNIAREKLSRLTLQQFHELSIDVYDELVRRKDASKVPFLSPRQDFHPKRNQARQKLAILPHSRFGDLTSDVQFEIERRYPEFNLQDMSGRDSCDDYLASAEGEEEEEKQLFGYAHKAAAMMTMQMAHLGFGERGRPGVEKNEKQKEIEARVKQLSGNQFKKVHPEVICQLRKLDLVRTTPTTKQDYRLLFKLHFEEFSRFLSNYLPRLPPYTRADSRRKLERLTIQQFHELSNDVYDELLRRKTECKVPFLPIKFHFHPKRNQARQKLSTLPDSRFNDLSGDVHFEILRRYPDFSIITKLGRPKRHFCGRTSRIF